MTTGHSRLGKREKVGLGIVLAAVVVIGVVNPGVLMFVFMAAAPIVFLAYLIWGLWNLVKRRKPPAVTSEMLPKDSPERSGHPPNCRRGP